MTAPNTEVPLALGIGPYHCDVEYFCNMAWTEIQLSLGHPQEALTFVGPALASAKEHGLTFRWRLVFCDWHCAGAVQGPINLLMTRDEIIDLTKTWVEGWAYPIFSA